MKVKTGIIVVALVLSLGVLTACSNDNSADTTFKSPPPPAGVTPAGAKNPQQAAEDAAKASTPANGNKDTGGDDKGN